MKFIYKSKLKYLLFIIVIISCTNREQNDKGYLSGVYSYELATGLFQKLEINKDYIFKQTLYSEKEGEVLYENYGKLYVNGIKIELQNWLECYEVDNDRNIFISEPYITTRGGVSWLKFKDSDEISIVLFDETDYIFKKEL